MRRIAGRAVVTVVVLALLAAGVQTFLYFQVRGSVSSAAADAARDAALDGGTLQGAVTRAEKQIRDDVDDADADAITCTAAAGTEAHTGLPTVTVRCRGELRLLLTHRGTPLTVDESTTVIRQRD